MRAASEGDDRSLPRDRPALSEAAQAAFFESAWKASELALRSGSASDVDLRIAGGTIRLRFASVGAALTMTRALSHLIVDAQDVPDAVVNLFDTAGSGVSAPRAPCARDCFTDRGDLWGLHSRRYRSAYHLGEFSLNLFDQGRREGVFWVRDFSALPYWSIAAPLRTILHWWLSGRGLHLVHAAAVGTEQGAVLLTGPGGVGKSTSAIASLASGLRFIGDDYLVLGLEPTPCAYALYSSAKLVPEQFDRFAELRAVHVDNPGADKAVLQLWPTFAAQLAMALPLRAMATPSFADARESNFVASTRARLAQAATFTTMSQLPHAGEDTVAFMRRLTESLPCLELQLGSDVSRVPHAIRRLLASNRIADSFGASDGFAADEPSASRGQPGGRDQESLSIVIPVHDGAHFLRDVLEHVLAHAPAHAQVLVVDDGSGDGPASILAAFPRVRMVRQDQRGPAAARNRGLAETDGDRIAFLDVDDLWADSALLRMLAVLDANPQIDVVHGHAQLLERDGQSGAYHYVGSAAETFPYSITGSVFRRRVFERVGQFNEALRFEEDAEWFVRAAELGARIERLNEVTLHVRRHGGNMTYGRSLAELESLRLLKLTLDRRRIGAG